MQSVSFARFLASVNDHLLVKKYTALGAAPPLQAGYFKLGALNLPYAIGIKDATITTNSPAQIFQQVANWFHSLVGRTGGGCLVLVYNDPPARVVDEIKKVGDGIVSVGHYDLLTGSHSVPDHLGWKADILGG